MKIFLDTCALFKLYHYEVDTNEFEKIFIENTISGVFLSELTKLEFASTLWRKVRMKEITELQAEQTISVLDRDLKKYNIVPIDASIIENAVKLVARYGKSGLRTLDSIQLSTAVSLKDKAGLFVTADKLLLSFFSKENLTVTI
ncbi:type II toxin-antitoxin system VapC family toxin [Sphingobacterium pedocola]|uniref:PIN domain-containing protein n=1 Tax=Sphingobacterium pedocola TaxID=2082722 RepID=A0ABR9TAC9_9SPHI|nr:type II toxin-antitoxin system VapC family toxin [Sphingobacterium pedocola]MBE8722296.1 hypothetical protein [Sphingobacterium pedocola]